MPTLRKFRATIIAGCIVVVVVVSAFAISAITGRNIGGRLVALVHDGNGDVRELPLDEDTELMVETDLGRNVIEVRNGVASISDADCPNLDCTRQAPISQPGTQLICLPHKLWVEIVPEGDPGQPMSLGSASPEDDPASIDALSG